MLTARQIPFNKKITSLLVCLFLSSNLLSLTGCATMGAKLATHIAEKEERKDCSETYDEKSAAVDQETCERITRLIKKVTKEEGGGFVAYDKSGRLKLKGTYENEDELALAHMIILTVVGTSGAGISPVTPRNLKEIRLVKSYEPQQSSYGKGEKYALLIGIKTFESKQITDIETAVKDVESLRESLISNEFKENNITVLTDENATKAKILDEMRKLQGRVTSTNDSVVLYISTHGTSPDTFGKMGIFPYDIKVKILDRRTESVQEKADKISKDAEGDNAVIKIAKDRIDSLKTAVSFNDIQDFATGVKTDKFVIILDTCYSGSALPALSPVGGKQYADREKNVTQSLGVESKAELLGGSQAQACTVSEYPDSITKLAMAFGGSANNSGTKAMYSEEAYNEPPSIAASYTDKDYMFEQFKTAFAYSDTMPQLGKVLLTATNGEEKSLFDKDRLPNSFFTFYLTKGLEKFNGHIFKAFDYAKVRTSNLVARDYHSRQTPEMTGVPKECINIDLSK